MTSSCPSLRSTALRTRKPLAAIALPLVGPGQRIGIMGGSFNPPHGGHQVVAETAIRRLALDQLWWVVTPGNPLKGGHDLAPLDERLAACRAMARGRHMRVTAIEADLGTNTTADLIAVLRIRLPTAKLVWIMGADNLASFHRWQRWLAIAHSIPFAVVDRPAWRLKALSSPAARGLRGQRWPEARARLLPGTAPPAWVFLTTRLSDQSSTLLRAARLHPTNTIDPAGGHR